MASLYPIASPLETRPAEPARVSVTQMQGGPAAEAAAKLRMRQQTQRETEVIPHNLSLRLDPEAGWFVQTVTDAVTQETLRKYPSEQQLAFSRAVMAYLRARIES